MTRLLVIPAAGRGSRLGWEGPKALYPIAGRPMIEHLLDRYAGVCAHTAIVAAPSALAAFETRIGSRNGTVEFVVQDAPTGMLPAILCAKPIVERYQPDEVWITWCDQVGISRETATRLARAMDEDAGAALVFPTVRQTPPYIHFDRDASGRISRVRQRREGDDMPAAGESDAGLFALRRDTYLRHLVEYDALPSTNGAGTRERNFLPFIPWLAARHPVSTVELSHPAEAVGVNTPADVQTVESFLRE